MKHGIYLNLPEQVYHGVDALSKSLVKQAMTSPRDAWESLYGEDGFNETDATRYGSALHKLILEGSEAFEKCYCKGFDKRDYPGALDTVGDLKAWLVSNDADFKKSLGKLDLIKTVLSESLRLEVEPPQIIAVLDAEHEINSKGKTQLPAADFDQIVNNITLIGQADTKNGGFTEVSFFWFDEALQCECKARIDYLRFNKAIAQLADVKTIFNRSQKEFTAACRSDISNFKYFIDATFYSRAVRMTPREFLSDVGELASIPNETEWPEDFELSTTFDLLFIEKADHPNWMTYELELFDASGSPSDLHNVAWSEIKQAADSINTFRESHGSEKPWNQNYKPQTYTVDDLPGWYLL